MKFYSQIFSSQPGMRLSVFLLLLSSARLLSAQTPQFFNYQAIARDANHQPLGNAAISVDVQILRNGTAVYSETDDLTTAPTGLFTIAVGKGNPADFQAIDWRLGNYELQVRLSGALDLVAPATPILAVPYALMANEVVHEKQQLVLNGNQLSISDGNTVTLSGTGGNPAALDDLTDVNTSGATSGQVLQWNGTAWVPATVSAAGSLTAGPGIQITGNQISSTGDINASDDLTVTTQAAGDVNGVFSNLQIRSAAVGNAELADGAVTAPKLAQMGAVNGQVLKWSGSAWTPQADVGGGNGDDWGNQVVNTDGTLSGNGTTGNTLKIAQQNAVNGQFLKWNGTTWTPADVTVSANSISSTQIVDNSITINDLAAGVIPTSLPPSGVAGGDLSGSYPNPTVGKLQGRTVVNIAPVDGQVLRYNGTSQQWEPMATNNFSWELDGNTGTNSNFNFIGTIDDQPLTFKINDIARMKLNNQGRLELFSEGYGNTIIGNFAGNSNTPGIPENYSGTLNVFLGFQSGYNNSSGYYNSFFGPRSGFKNATGSSNCFFGNDAGFSNITGYNNAFFGNGAGLFNSTGLQNSFFGNAVGQSNTTGRYNCFFGHQSGVGNTIGNGNAFYGEGAGSRNTSGNYNSCVGYDTNLSDSTLFNAMALGANSFVSASNTIALGNTSITSIKGQVGFTTFSDARIKTNIQENIPGLAFIRKLRPVTYHYDIHRQNALIGIVDTAQWDGKYDIEKMTFSGFLAQEVEQAAQSLGYDFSGVDAPQNDKSLYGLRYAEFTVPLVKAVQEQQAIIETQKAELNDLKNQLSTLQLQVQALVNQSGAGEVKIKTKTPE